MSHPLRQSPRIRAIAWRDLTALRPHEQIEELLLPLPFLRLVHDAFQDNLALPRQAGHALLVALSSVMLGSMHAVRITHLQHHRDCLGPDDVEGQTARRRAVHAIGAGVLFPFRLHQAA